MPKAKAPGEPEKKGERLRRLVREEQWHAALKLAASLSSLGEDKKTIQRAWQAVLTPQFTRQIGHDPDALIEEAKGILRRRFGAAG